MRKSLDWTEAYFELEKQQRQILSIYSIIALTWVLSILYVTDHDSSIMKSYQLPLLKIVPYTVT